MDKIENVSDSEQKRLNMLQASLQAVMGKGDLFANIIDFFPYHIEVFDRDGTTVMINRAFLNDFNIPSRDMVVGKYNIFKDPEVEKLGVLQVIKEIFGGRGAYTITDIKVPLKSIREVYQTDSSAVDAVYQDVTGFPIFDEHGEVSHVVLMFITRRIYQGKGIISKAIEYLDNNWDKKFNLNETAKAANLSPYHFARVFKGDTGMTPRSYHIKLKIEHLMEKLRDPNFTVKEAFDACGLEYTGQIFGIFKNYVGVTPAQYQEAVKQK